MKQRLFLAVDLGTSFIKTSVYSIGGLCRAAASAPVACEKPEPGAFVQPGETMFKTMQANIFKKFYWWEAQSTEKMEQTFGIHLVYRSWKEVCQKAREIPDEDAKQVGSEWQVYMDILNKCGITKMPETTSELKDLCEKVSAQGYQVFTTGIKDGWPVKHMFQSFLNMTGEDAAVTWQKISSGEKRIEDYPSLYNDFFNFFDLIVKYGGDKPLESSFDQEVADMRSAPNWVRMVPILCLAVRIFR